MEEICVERFLNWYNKQRKRDYKRTEDHFTELKGKLRWDFIVYERVNPEEWIGIEVKEIAIVRAPSIQLGFWQGLCSELTQDLAGKGIRGEFYIFPPDVDLKRGDRSEFRKAFVEVLYQKAPNMKVNEIIDIGPNIASKFPNWPTEKSEPFDEYDKRGTYRPCQLEIKKISDSGCEVTSPISPIRAFSVPEAHREAFNEVFKLKNDAIWANKQLKLAKEYGAMKTILLLACNVFVDEGLTKNYVQNLGHHLIAHIDCIYLVDVDIGNKDRVVEMYPS